MLKSGKMAKNRQLNYFVLCFVFRVVKGNQNGISNKQPIGNNRMKTDIYSYRDSLQTKLDAVNSIIAEMGGTTRKGKGGRPAGVKLVSSGKPRKKRKPMSAAVKAKMKAAAIKRWADKKAAEKK